jgi:inorganic pyrophosphatase
MMDPSSSGATRHAMAALIGAIAVGQAALPPPELPAAATAALARSVAASKAHRTHVWRDTPPLNADGTLNGYIEIARGDRRKWEYDMARNARVIDRVMPEDPGGYPVNYGFVPQTVSYDGDPFDVLVLGPPLAAGRLVRGVIVALMQMEDENGLDSKVVISPANRSGRAPQRLTAEDERLIGDYFKRYKQHEPRKFSKVPGWAGPEAGLTFVRRTHAFFRECQRLPPSAACKVRERPGG